MNRARRIAAGNFIILSEALLSCPSAAAVNGAAYEEYPVRVIVGVVALVLALVLTLFTVLGRWIRQANKKRSYGSQMQYGTHTASHKTVKKGRRRYGKPELAMFFPSYRGRRSKAARAKVPAPAAASRHRKIKGRRSRYGGRMTVAPNRGYTGGKSRAGAAVFFFVPPDSHRKKQGGDRRYGKFALPALFSAYRGGGSVAGPARFESTLPLSHRGRTKANKN